MVQLPALNMPEFDWARNKMPQRPRPFGTIFQPEVAAEAITRAANGRRREVLVGLSTVLTVLGNKPMPMFFDRYPAITTFDGQLAAQVSPAGEPDTSFSPPLGDPGERGRFDVKAKAPRRALAL
jgi:hypothetical protein